MYGRYRRRTKGTYGIERIEGIECIAGTSERKQNGTECIEDTEFSDGTVIQGTKGTKFIKIEGTECLECTEVSECIEGKKGLQNI